MAQLATLVLVSVSMLSIIFQQANPPSPLSYPDTDLAILQLSLAKI